MTINKKQNNKKSPDFSGVATKAGIKCSDGRTIGQNAFKDDHGKKVPLVWQHGHDTPDNVLGHGVLKYMPNGDVRLDGYFNNTVSGQQAKAIVHSGDVDSLSIWANELREENLLVQHGAIKEVSLVLSGANPGAKIDYIDFGHGDFSESEAFIYSGQKLDSDDDIEEVIEHDDTIKVEETIGDVFETLNPKQKAAVNALIDAALEAQDEETNVEHDDLNNKPGDDEKMKRNAFTDKKEEINPNTVVLSHSEINEVLIGAQKNQSQSVKAAYLAHVQTYGIENVDYLFPDAKTLRKMPDEIMRDQGWVGSFFGGSFHTPFSRIKSMAIDLTLESARALGYVKGTLKKEDFFALTKRVTTPSTVYIKRSIDRDDIIDATDYDVVAWQKGFMKTILNEEVARAALIGDGREPEDEDKISESNIRPVYKDAEFYAPRLVIASNKTTLEAMDLIVSGMEAYKGTGSPAFYTTMNFFLKMLLVRDTTGRRMYNSKTEVASALNVSDIVTVPLMVGVSRSVTSPSVATHNLLGIVINPADYTFGADKGGAVAMFDDFDIDYNRQKFLLETRVSGALTKPASALIIEQTAAG